MTVLPDVIGAIVTFLKDDADVNAITSGRIYGGELPPSVVPNMPAKVIVVKDAGGVEAFGTAYQEWGDKRYDVICYGTTPKTAKDVYRNVYPAMKQLRREVHLQTLLHWAKQAGGPMPLRDPDTDWPSTFSSWQVLSAEVTVSV
jgi:hypothetical protein